MPALFDPIVIRNLRLRNRLWVPAMCQYAVLKENGVPTEWQFVHLGSLAAGGAGLVITEATAVNAQGRISPRDTGIWNDEQRDAWAPIVNFIHSQGAAAGIQLAHAGRKASTWPAWGFEDKHGTVQSEDRGWRAVGPSALAFPGYDEPLEASIEDIDAIVADFAAGARHAVEAGFDVLELHAAHGYLLHQFLSPLSNHREDEYGGSLENRARLLLRVVAAVREAVGEEKVLFVRFSATDYIEGGWNEEETATVATWAAEVGADFFDVSSGGNVAARIPLGPGYQVPLAAYVKERAEVPVSAVGLITTAEQAAQIVETGQADAVMMGRELLRDPHFPLKAAAELGVELDYWPQQYLRARVR